jgi:membrane-associated phospholipid phosphatase
MSLAAPASVPVPTVTAAARYRRLGLLVPLGLAVLALLALPLDLPITRFATGENLPKIVEKLIRLTEAFSHGSSVPVIMLAIFFLDRAHRTVIPRLAIGTALGGGLANVCKLFLERTRPRRFDLHGAITDSFGSWLPFGRLPATQESFPSAHAATGAALAVLLCWLYPQGRPFFIGLAIVSGLQRVFAAAHYPSDVLFGAALGCLAAFACLPGGLLGRYFDRFEAWIAPGSEAAEPRGSA